MDRRLTTAVVICALGLVAFEAAAACSQAAGERVAQPMDQDAEQQAQGPLSRVIVKVRETAGANTADTASAQDVIERNKAQLVELMRGHGAVTIEPLAGPLVVMEVTPQGMQNLLGSSLVEGVQEDRPEMAQ